MQGCSQRNLRVGQSFLVFLPTVAANVSLSTFPLGLPVPRFLIGGLVSIRRTMVAKR